MGGIEIVGIVVACFFIIIIFGGISLISDRITINNNLMKISFDELNSSLNKLEERIFELALTIERLIKIKAEGK